MSGKAYTMKEMKSIVDYITEHKTYAEIKGRKMWMDFANSKLTNRTWQSLKETFLKRILTDIYNPYYKLSVDQIRCFKEGSDVIAREKNKLEIVEIDDSSNLNAEKRTETEKPSTSHDNNGEASSGEDIKCAKIQSHDRASVDTVIIANCYETDDELRKVLESEASPKSDNNEHSNTTSQNKSLRDLITYSEPLTPMLQEVLHDFASDESEGELVMQIVENDEESNAADGNEEPIEIFDSDDVIEKNDTTENVVMKETQENLKQDKAEKAAEDNLSTNKPTETNQKTNIMTATNVKEINAADGSVKKDKPAEDNSNKEKSIENNLDNKETTDSDLSKEKDAEVNSNKEENITVSNKRAEDILEKDLSTKAILNKDKAPDKLNAGHKENDKSIQNSVDKTEEKIGVDEYEVVGTEEFVQPKVISLKLRKRKLASEKKEEKKSTSKIVKSRAEMYEIVEPEILERSTDNVPDVDSLSNHARQKHEIISSTVHDKLTQNSSNSDTILPNNQEALNSSGKRVSADNQPQNDISKSPNESKKVVKPKVTRKRANSQDVPSKSKVKKNMLNVDTNGKEKAVSDTDDVVMKKLIMSKLKKSKLELKKKTVIKEVENEIKKTCEVSNKTSSKDNIVEDMISTSKPLIDSSQASDLNPCLKSVSLYAEQFNTVSYIDSESEHETTPAASATDKKTYNKPSTSRTNENKKKPTVKCNEKVAANMGNMKENEKSKKIKSTPMNVDEVVILKSHSDSESETKEETLQKSRLPVSQDIAKAQRDKALASVFGFYSGGLKRKKRMSYRKNSAYYQRRTESSFDSSEWTSESDSEAYVSPPRGRKNKQARKYLKPHSARILSLEDEGGLFVMYGKKIYPLVKDGKIIKNYLTYLPESDPEEEDSYWKLKYVEERKRVAELKKLMKENEEEIVREKSPILPVKPIRLSTPQHQGSPCRNGPNKDSSKELVGVQEKEIKHVDTGKETTLKITFAKNNQEVHMEGHWSHIHPVLAEVVQIFNKDNDSTASRPARPVATKRPSDATSELSVAVPSPVDEEILEKVNKLETEIFKEIEDRHQEEVPEEPKEQPEANVTKRKRASKVRKSTSTRMSSDTHSPPSSTRSPKRQKISSDEPKNEHEDQEKVPRTRNKKVSQSDVKDVKPSEVVKEAVEAVDSTTSVATKKRTRLSKKESNEAVNTTEVKTRSTRQSKPPAEESKANSSQVEDDEIRYMLPPAPRSRKSSLTLSKSKDKSKR